MSGNGGDARGIIWEKALGGPVAVVDCSEEIPCNPCEEACRRGAIKIGEDICAPPSYDPGACDGCGRCVAVCPGMAITLIDRSRGEGSAGVTVPYEMKGALEKGEELWAVDQKGKTIGAAKIEKVALTAKEDKSLLVTVEVPEEWALKVRGARNREKSIEEPEEITGYSGEEDYTFCRCEEITCEEVRDMMAEGFQSLTALRRCSRVGMGVCQGRFCQNMLREEFAEEVSGRVGEMGIFRVRPPVRPVKLSRLGGEDG